MPLKCRLNGRHGLQMFLLPGCLYVFMLLLFPIQDYLLIQNWGRITYKNPYPPDIGKETLYSKEEITFVTAYFNIGKFRKGKKATDIFTAKFYYNWMTNLALLNNTVILFTDMDDLAEKFKERRTKFKDYMTKIFLVKQENFWAFRLSDKIKEIFREPGYPKYFPNTVSELYSCAMHVKYEIIEKVISEKLIHTKYLAWIDIGYFRDKEKEIFKLFPPDNIKHDHISFTQIGEFKSDASPTDILYDNLVWIAGGLFIGTPEYLILFCEDYKSTLQGLMSQQLVSTDQQVLYSMYSPKSVFRPRVPIQSYYRYNRRELWFYLGELCKEQGLKRLRKKQRINEIVMSHLLY